MSEIPRESIERAVLELNTLTAGIDADNQRYVATDDNGLRRLPAARGLRPPTRAKRSSTRPRCWTRCPAHNRYW